MSQPTIPAFDSSQWNWIDAQSLTILGQGWREESVPYTRLPDRAKSFVTANSWYHSRFPAGLCVHFVVESPCMALRWNIGEIARNFAEPPLIFQGVDLYVRMDDRWQWVRIGRVNQFIQDKQTSLALQPGKWEMMLYLPLGCELKSVHIGVPQGGNVASNPVPLRTDIKPIFIYGTSIVHGFDATRPGMTYPALISRRLNIPVWNMGLAGSAHCETGLGELFAELDASVYVIDPIANMQLPWIEQRIEPLVNAIRSKRKSAPIVLIERPTLQDAFEKRERAYTGYECNHALRAVYERMLASGITNLHYIPGKDLLGSDGDGTIDGVHPTDVGFMRMANQITPVLRDLIEIKK